MATPTTAQLTTLLTALGLPPPNPSFLAPILIPPPSRSLPPLPALVATAKHRLLSTDLTAPQVLLPSAASLPNHIASPTLPSQTLPCDVVLQVLEVEDTSRSKWEQIEALDMERKGEFIKGREVIRVVPANEDEPSSASTQAPQGNARAVNSYGPFKLSLQDWKGATIYGFELQKVPKIGYPPTMSIGSKILLKKGIKVARGMVLLDPRNCVVLGGKVEGLDKAWQKGREQELRDSVGGGRKRSEV
ncbi:RecQ mediated genome instability protein Rmi1 [Calycina marina]|uniref:RecQ-mediated genome instability protein 1 n=1 Tax=Calycina marina TaxID=1763456 RepID=A0A9P7Z319_9HELO|nr:RecQ mediated genome instability protein Rmi1 [Calycina marina]